MDHLFKFGTDGIRGEYGKTLTEDAAYRLGAALGGNILLGRDNRPSSPSLASALIHGATSVSGQVKSVGILTTPALYYLLTISDAKYAVMVTASHNPPAHNGLKVFTKDGKLSEQERKRIEERMRAVFPAPSRRHGITDEEGAFLYKEYVKRRIGALSGIKIVVDYAGGAGSAFKGLFREMGAKEIPLNARKNGDRINDRCGALYPEGCKRAVLKENADLGVAIDGDGDRIAVIDQKGNLLNGDNVTYLLACRMQARGALANGGVAMTIMTNGGVLSCLRKKGITPFSSAVGDAALSETMRANALNLGGEQSGHIILGDYLFTGDGLLVGAYLAKSVLEDGPLDVTPLPRLYPQILLNVPVPDPAVAEASAVRLAAEQMTEELQEGRVLLRASGTESVVRIMVEHPKEEIAKRAAERLAEVVKKQSLP